MNTYTVAIPFLSSNCERYFKAVRAVGMEPVRVSSLTATAECDGLLLPGGADVDPALYNEELNGSLGVNDKLDALQFGMLEKYCAARKPVLGICRGHQVINVFFGGSLWQHISSADAHAMIGSEEQFHTVYFTEGSFLERMYSAHPVVNSSHHQGVKLLGEELEIIARADDGTVEGIIHRTLPVTGVQWHPERMLGDSGEKTDGMKIFERFRDLCMGRGER